MYIEYTLNYTTDYGIYILYNKDRNINTKANAIET